MNSANSYDQKKSILVDNKEGSLKIMVYKEFIDMSHIALHPHPFFLIAEVISPQSRY